MYAQITPIHAKIDNIVSISATDSAPERVIHQKLND